MINSRNAQGQPWYEWVHRWGQTNLTEDDPARHNIDFWRAQWKRTRVQGLIVNCGGIVAYYPSRFGLQYRAATLGDMDYFAEFSAAAREEGLVIVARMDINRATEEFYQAHPDWFCVDREGKPITSQGRYFSCVNSPYYKEYIPQVLTEIIEKYRPVGFADNSWKGLDRHTVCYCANCRKGFREYAGMDLPEKADWDDPAYRAWIRWSYACRTANWDLFNETTQKAGGEDCLWLGMLHADPANLAGGFGDLKALCARSRYIFSDHQSRDPLNGFEQNSQNGVLLRMASPSEDTIAPESFANYVRGPRTFRLAANPWQETYMWMVSGAAGGISPWYHHIGGSEHDRRQFETPVPFFRWHAENEAYLYHRENLAGIGLVWSQANADFYGRDRAKERVALPWRGFCRALSEASIPFIPVHADDIGRYASRLHTLILPDVAVLSPAQEESVVRFARAGKNLVVTGRTALLDADGLPKDPGPLWKLLGLRLTGKTEGSFDEQPSTWEYPLAHTYLHLGAERHPVLDGFEDTDIIGFGGGMHIAASEGPLRPLCGYVMPFPIYPPEFSWIREIRDDLHPVFAGTLPEGGRAVYFAADIDRCCGRGALPDHMRLLENAVRWAAGDRLRFRVESIGHIDASLYRQGSRYILHLVNLSGCNESPGYLHRLLPVGPVRVTMPAPEGASRVKLLVSGKELPCRTQDGLAFFTVESITGHEVAVVE